MPTLITTSTAATPIGYGHQGHLFKLPRGPYAGRLIAVMARSPSVIAWSRADAPYTDWTDPVDVITDAADDPCAAVMDADGNVYVVYTNPDGALRHVKLVNVGGTWAKGTTVTVYDSATSSNRFPTILKDTSNGIRINWTRIDSGVYSLRAKMSIDDGVTFGGGETDPGLELDTGSSSLYSQVLQRSVDIHCVYTRDGAALKHRQIELDAALWQSAETLYTGTVQPRDVHVALSADNVLGVLFATDANVFLKEFDGAVWGSLQAVATGVFTSPILHYVRATPFAQMLASIGLDQQQIVVSQRLDDSFTTPQPALTGHGSFDTVFCFNADADSSFADCTTAASDLSPGDVQHPESGALVEAVGDAVYLGMNRRFAVVHLELSTPGSGGGVVWEYWDGTSWIGFVPVSGNTALDASSTAIQLFTDTQAIPVDWTKTLVNGVYRFWIRAVVTTGYTIAPVGSQVTAAANVTQISPGTTR